MKRCRVLAFGVAAALLVRAAPGVRADDPDDAYEAALARATVVEDQLVGALAKVRPASVSVVIKKRIPAATPGASEVLATVGCGSGVIVTWNQRTWIVTNDHVAGGADALEVVTLDGKVHPAELVDSVKTCDVALLRFTGRTTGLKGVQLVPKASRDLAEGQWVLATGNPFFLAMDGRSVSTLGVVSGLERVLGDRTHLYGNAIQHDAAVNPGNSGGPLWNLRGELVGINGMIASRGINGLGPSNTGASFSIPIHDIVPYLDQLADKRKDAQAGFLGVLAETATDAKGSPSGARALGFEKDCPARGPEDNGLLEGDVITAISIAGKVVPIRTATDLVNALSACPAGTSVRISYKRKDRSSSWTGKLGAQQ